LQDHSSHNEKELFRLIAEGNETAFEELFHLYVPRIQPVVYKIVKSEPVVKDIIQEIFLAVWLDREKLTVIDEPRNWIFKITYNCAYRWVKRQLVREKAKVRIGKEQEEIQPAGNTAENDLLFAETARLVKEAINALPPQSKKIYQLNREAGMKIADIAQELDISPQSVKNSLFRSGKTIREYLVQKGILLPLVLIFYYLA
jgi:RNA polymerase sigma-70 factor (ECF subfamily)